MESSSSTFPQTHIFFVSNIKGLAQTILTREGKVFAAPDAADAHAAETDWKYEVTPDRGDLMNVLRKTDKWIITGLVLSHHALTIPYYS